MTYFTVLDSLRVIYCILQDFLGCAQVLRYRGASTGGDSHRERDQARGNRLPTSWRPHVTVSAGTTMSAPPTLSGFSLSQLVSALEAKLEKCAQSDL